MERLHVLDQSLRNDYRVVIADPPWHFKSNSPENPGRNPMRHYEVMSADEIIALPIAQMIADDAILWLWVPGPFLAIGAHVALMAAWGFKPSGMGFVWIKLNPTAVWPIEEVDLATGPGFTTRKNAEYCVIGKRGRSVRKDAGVHEVIVEPRREHSRKPDKFYERVLRYSPGPYLELFARETRPGIDGWGKEATLFDPQPRPASLRPKAWGKYPFLRNRSRRL